MDLPGFNLHTMKGKYKGYWPVSGSGNWRVIFRFEDNGAVFAVQFDSFGGNVF
jgi:proteic killer suppression protein